MASRVNLKFVFALGSVLVLFAAVVAYVGWNNLSGSGVEQNLERGRKAEKEGDLKKAISFYGRAVFKDSNNLEAIKTWLDAIQRFTPPARQAYEDMYVQEYTGALRAAATADKKNPAAFRRFLDERYQLTEKASPNLRGWENYSREYEDFIKNFQGDESAKTGLRRYHGLARAAMLQHNPELSETSIKEGKDDLEAALTIDPADAECVIALCSLDRGLAERAARLGRQSEADKLTAGVASRLSTFAAAHPDAQRLRYVILTEAVGESIRSAMKETRKDVPPPTMLDVLTLHRDKIVALAEAIKSVPPEKTDASVALSITPWLMMTAPKTESEKGLLPGQAGQAERDALMAHVRKGHAADPAFLLGSAQLESSVFAYEKAINLCKEVVALPDKPMSLDGLLLHNIRASAILMEASATFAWWESEKQDLAKREVLLKQVRDLRTDLAARVGESDARVLGIDGRLALASGEIPRARTIISSYNEQTQNRDIGMVLLEAELLVKIGQKGAAKDKFQTVLQTDKANIRALYDIAMIEVEDRDWASAADHLGSALKLLPNDPKLQDLAGTVNTILAGKYTADPQMEFLVKAQDDVSGPTGSILRGIATLQAGLVKYPADPRLTGMLARFHVANRDIPAAIALVEDSITKKPDDAGLKKMLAQLQADPVKMALDQINAATLTEVQKHLMRYQLYMRAGKPDEAHAALAEASRLEPDSPAVIDSQFDDAILRYGQAQADLKDQKPGAAEALAAAEADQARLVAKAQTLNLDRVGGALYNSRSLVARGKIAEAIGGFREVVTKDKLNLLAWRLLGMALLQQNRYGEAIDALKTAVGIKPDDVPSIDSYLQALVAAKREGEALAFARKSENLAYTDPVFFEMLMLLEAGTPGGDKAKAINARKKLVERDPKNRGNKARLATLLVNSNRNPEADALIKELRTGDPKDPVALQIEAAFLGRQNKVAEAVALLRQFIDSLPPAERKVELYINNARLLRQLGQPQEASKTLDEARPLQDPKNALVDREIGDMMYDMAANVPDKDPEKAKAAAIEYYKKSLAAYQKVLDGGGEDIENAVRKRMIEVCLKSEDFERMNQIIGQLPSAAQGDATVLLLQAEAAAIQKDNQKAIKFYDQAVTADPKDTMVYFKRGDFKASIGQIKDALSDYEQMNRIEHDNVIGHLRQAKILGYLGRDVEAIQHIKDCIAIDPFNENYRLALAAKLAEIGKSQEAAQAMDEAAAAFPGNRQWRSLAAQYWARVPDWTRASEHMLAIWKENKPETHTVDVAVPLIEYLLNRGDVTTAFNILQAPELENSVKTSLPLRMLRARVLAKSNRTGEAAQLIGETLKGIDQNSNEQTSLFMSGVTGIYLTPADQFKALDQLETSQPFTAWLALKANSMRLRDDALKAKALLALRALTEGKAPDKVKAATWSVLGSQAYTGNDFDQARTCFQNGVQIDPDNAELCNNYAYILSVKLGKCEEALPYTLKAARSDSQNSGYLDTLGATQICNKKCEEAVQTLNQALNVAKNDAERIPVYIHLGKARIAQKVPDRNEAKRLADQARNLMSTLPTIRTQYDADLKELDRAIDSK